MALPVESAEKSQSNLVRDVAEERPAKCRRTGPRMSTGGKVRFKGLASRHDSNEDEIICKLSSNRGKKIVDLDDEASLEKLSAMTRAERVQANLPAKYPSFVKLMLPSFVSKEFCLLMPTSFCKVYLPKCDSCVVELVDQAGGRFRADYLANKSSLTGGWWLFSTEHGLKNGDAAVFQLIVPATFKVYIVREGSLGEADGALGLLSFDSPAGQETSDVSSSVNLAEDSSPLNLTSTHSSSDEQASQVTDSHISGPAIRFEDVKSFEDFRIIVNGNVVDSKFCDSTRRMYYELCQSQNSFLHENVLKDKDGNTAIGMILEVANIEKAIRAITSSTPIEKIRIWDRTLSSFGHFRMNVNFMRAKLKPVLDAADGERPKETRKACIARVLRGIQSLLAEVAALVELEDEN